MTKHTTISVFIVAFLLNSCFLKNNDEIQVDLYCGYALLTLDSDLKNAENTKERNDIKNSTLLLCLLAVSD